MKKELAKPPAWTIPMDFDLLEKWLQASLRRRFNLVELVRKALKVNCPLDVIISLLPEKVNGTKLASLFQELGRDPSEYINSLISRKLSGTVIMEMCCDCRIAPVIVLRNFIKAGFKAGDILKYAIDTCYSNEVIVGEFCRMRLCIQEIAGIIRAFLDKGYALSEIRPHFYALVKSRRIGKGDLKQALSDEHVYESDLQVIMGWLK